MMHFTIVRKETLALEATLDLLTSRLYYIPFSSHRQLYILCDSSIVVQRVCRLRRLRKTLESSSESPERMPSKQKLGAWEYAHCLKIADSLDQLAKQFGDDKVHFHHCPGKLNPADFYSRGEPPLTRTLEEAQVWLNSLFNNHAGTPEDHTINIVDSSPPTAAPTTTTTVPSSVATDLFSYVIDAQQTDPFCRVARKLITGSNLPTPDDLHDLFIDYTDDQKAKIKATYRVKKAHFTSLPVRDDTFLAKSTPTSAIGQIDTWSSTWSLVSTFIT
ncbi:hypothetical protein FOL47_003612 [Perkinsus chesapeaki]|uniref:Uncharacterized protein n=1 Tax=Perkinsus chesapeaki TaxID=330153 RepID=A0A7J6KMC2_PERCH|nr:hypothetical protein FOL47_003612 [Perkinsus chesapeaki]